MIRLIDTAPAWAAGGAGAGACVTVTGPGALKRPLLEEAGASGRPTDTGATCPDTCSGLLTNELTPLLWPPITLEGSTRDLSVDPANIGACT